jgi:hypothetical protein
MNGRHALVSGLSSAMPAWEEMLRHSSWHQAVLAVAYGLVGLLCLVVARAGKVQEADERLWGWGGIALLLMAAIALLSLDLLSVQVLRTLAREQGWYANRRLFQAGVLLALGLVAVLWLARRPRAPMAPARSLGLIGLALLAGTAALRFVSHHETDAVLNARIAGLMLGRLLELLGLGLTALGALGALRRLGY